MTRPTDPRFEVFTGSFLGSPAEIVAQPNRGGFEVVAWLNPSGGIPTGHRTAQMTEEQWTEVRRFLTPKEIGA